MRVFKAGVQVARTACRVRAAYVASVVNVMSRFLRCSAHGVSVQWAANDSSVVSSQSVIGKCEEVCWARGGRVSVYGVVKGRLGLFCTMGSDGAALLIVQSHFSDK